MRNPVETRKLKFDGSAKPSWHGDLVDAVEDRWLVVFFERPPYAIRGEAVVFALQFYGMRQPLSVLVCFDAAGRAMEWQCDAGLPARIMGRVIEFIDLDLDVMVNPDGTYYVRDLEDFEARSTAMGYSEEARQAAWKGVALALLLVKRRRYPFDGSAEALLGRCWRRRGRCR
jgi:protein associated with RNAse G/E